MRYHTDPEEFSPLLVFSEVLLQTCRSVGDLIRTVSKIDASHGWLLFSNRTLLTVSVAERAVQAIRQVNGDSNIPFEHTLLTVAKFFLELFLPIPKSTSISPCKGPLCQIIGCSFVCLK